MTAPRTREGILAAAEEIRNEMDCTYDHKYSCFHQTNAILSLARAPQTPAVGPRQPAYDAVYAVIRQYPPRSTNDDDQAAENARVWRAVEAALDAVGVLTAEQYAALEARVAASQPRRRLKACVERWPEAEIDGDYDPRCCRFPKSCSASVYDEGHVTDDDLEPA